MVRVEAPSKAGEVDGLATVALLELDEGPEVAEGIEVGSGPIVFGGLGGHGVISKLRREICTGLCSGLLGSGPGRRRVRVWLSQSIS